jgi:hypothetical protein
LSAISARRAIFFGHNGICRPPATVNASLFSRQCSAALTVIFADAKLLASGFVPELGALYLPRVAIAIALTAMFIRRKLIQGKLVER